MKIFLNSFFIIFLITIFVSINTNAQDKNKKKLTLEEVKEMCGVPVDKDEMKKVLAIQDSLYKEYLKKKGLKKTTTIPNWQNYMSNVDNQYGCKNCWAHAATGMVEGQLQIIYGSKIGSNGIDLDEMDIVNNSGHTGGCNNGDFPTTALSYIQSSKVISEIGSYPNLQGVRWDINSFSILGVMGGIDGIKNALINGPVTASFYVYQSFYDFFDLYENRTSIYHQENPLGDPYIGGHAVVIVSYNEDQQYWLCKNSWGSWWADGGYFRIGYGQCGIETWQNCTVTVNQSCYAKIVPNLINSLNTAFSYGFENGEWARLDNNRITLSNSLALPYPGTLNLSSSNITVPSNITFTINSGTKVLLNGNSIVSSGGTISVSSGAYSDGAKLLSTSGSIKGIYLPQTAINNAVIGEKVELLGSTYYTNISISNKYNVDLYGNGTSSSVINGNISVNNSQYIDVNNLKASRLAINGGVNNFTNNILLENPGVDVLSIYNCPSQTITYSSIMNSDDIGAYINNSIGSFEHCNIEGHGTGLYFYNSSSFNVDNSYMCGNYPYDMYALAPAIAHCHTNTYSNVPTSSCHGNVIIMGTSNICMVLKANAERSV
ncbi:MAG: hypothetical protein NTX22_17115, partial [Ignavibacteriales bacterium]|nr:hypothetical protein [Ignavibacteriales bacterium]